MKNLIFILTTALFILFSTNAFSQIEVISNGNVGIGTSSPWAKLQVVGDVVASGKLKANNYVSASYFRNKTYGQPINLQISDLMMTIQKSSGWALFNHNKVGFGFRRVVNFSKNIYPLSTNIVYCGTYSKRWKAGYFTKVYRVTEHSLSDKRMKENFRNIEKPLDVIMQLNGQLYDYIPEVFMPQVEEEEVYRSEENTQGNQIAKDEKRIDSASENDIEVLKVEAEKDRKNHYGFIAQEVKEILPNVVEYNEETKLYSVSYTAMIPVLVEAIKEQQKQIEELKQLIEKK